MNIFIEECFSNLNEYVNAYYKSEFMQKFFLDPVFIIKFLNDFNYRGKNGSKDN